MDQERKKLQDYFLTESYVIKNQDQANILGLN